MPTIDIRQSALELLLITVPKDKVQGVADLVEQVSTNGIEISRHALDVPEFPGRPDKPDLVAPRDLPRRRNTAESGHAALIHAITHIEFNAINLALDAIARFADLPEAFYRDWLRVAAEEATHFTMLNAHLAEAGKCYGDFPAHDGMWEMARKTHHDPLIRMALVPRVLEARGLDVTPKMMDKLRASGDHKVVEILELILREEIGHVAIGTRWFNYLCDQRQLDPLSTFSDLLNIYFAGELRGPFHDEARKQAGFTEAEMAMLNSR